MTSPKWKHFPRYWPIVRGIHRSPLNSPHKGQWRGDLMFTLICARINGCVNNREAGDLRRHRAHYDVIVMACGYSVSIFQTIHITYSVSVLKWWRRRWWWWWWCWCRCWCWCWLRWWWWWWSEQLWMISDVLPSNSNVSYSTIVERFISC